LRLLLISSIKLAVPIVIMLLCNALVPLTAYALSLNTGPSDSMFLPVPDQSIPTFHHSISSSNYITQNTQDKPVSSSNIQNQSIPSLGSNVRYHYNNSASWATRDQKDSSGLWNPILAAAPFLNIPKNLIVPSCQQNSSVNSTTSENCPAIIGTQRGDIIIATAVNDARILGLGGNDVIECGTGNCKVFTAFGNNILMSGSSFTAQLYGGSGGYLRPGNNIFIGGGGVTLMVGGHGNDQFYAGSNNLFDGGNDIMIGGSGANYFDCGPNGNGVILDFNPAKGDSKASNCKYVITTYSNNIFGTGLPEGLREFNENQASTNSTGSLANQASTNSTGSLANQASTNSTGSLASFPGLRELIANHANTMSTGSDANTNGTGASNTNEAMPVLPAHSRVLSTFLHCCT
jgi:hypothetical protein